MQSIVLPFTDCANPLQVHLEITWLVALLGKTTSKSPFVKLQMQRVEFIAFLNSWHIFAFGLYDALLLMVRLFVRSFLPFYAQTLL